MVPLNKTKHGGGIGGAVIVHLVSQSHGYWLRRKRKEKRNVDDVTHWVLSFWLNLRLGSFFASSSCSFFSFPLLLFSLVHLAGVSLGARGSLFGVTTGLWEGKHGQTKVWL